VQFPLQFLQLVPACSSWGVSSGCHCKRTGASLLLFQSDDLLIQPAASAADQLSA
jgi:hypothetical protein